MTVALDTCPDVGARATAEAPSTGKALDEMVIRAMVAVSRTAAAVGMDAGPEPYQAALKTHLRDCLSPIAADFDAANTRIAALTLAENTRIVALEEQLAALTLERDAARELLDAEAHRFAVTSDRQKRAVIALAEMLFEELRS